MPPQMQLQLEGTVVSVLALLRLRIYLANEGTYCALVFGYSPLPSKWTAYGSML